MALKLYDNPLSPYALKIRGILYEKGIEFEKNEVDTIEKRDELLRLNPRAEVPAIVDGNTVVFDSKVIAEYLEERYPSPALLPTDPAARARCRALELAADTQLDAAVVAYMLFTLFRPDLKEKLPRSHAQSIELVRRHYHALERELGDGDYFVGTFSRADLTIAPHVGGAAFGGLGPDESTPRLSAWLARMNERPSIKRATAEAIAFYERSMTLEHPFFDNAHLHMRSERIEHVLRLGMGPWLLEELNAGRAFLPPMP